MVNLDSPQWIPVNCSQKLLSDIICLKPKHQFLQIFEMNINRSHCPAAMLLHSLTCIHFSFFNGQQQTVAQEMASSAAKGLLVHKSKDISWLQFIFVANEDATITILMPGNKSTSHLIRHISLSIIIVMS